MASTTVAQLATELNRTADALLEQLQAAGVPKQSADDAVTPADQAELLAYLQRAHGTTETSARKKITLTKRETSEIRQADSSGKTRTVQVEVRKKRVLVKRSSRRRNSKPNVQQPKLPPRRRAPTRKPRKPRKRSRVHVVPPPKPKPARSVK